METNIAHNTASVSGGGIYAYQSELNFKESCYIKGNRALQKGGGIYAVSTTTRFIKGSLHFIQNKAERGGGVCLELNAKLYVVKSEGECHNPLCNTNLNMWLTLYFTGNSAKYEGAVYVTDEQTLVHAVQCVMLNSPQQVNVFFKSWHCIR